MPTGTSNHPNSANGTITVKAVILTTEEKKLPTNERIAATIKAFGDFEKAKDIAKKINSDSAF